MTIVRKLNTSINHLLLWLCAASLLEATLGILAKCLIIGHSNLISHSHYHQIDCYQDEWSQMMVMTDNFSDLK